MESAQSWKELLLDLKRRGLSMGPELGSLQVTRRLSMAVFWGEAAPMPRGGVDHEPSHCRHGVWLHASRMFFTDAQPESRFHEIGSAARNADHLVRAARGGGQNLVMPELSYPLPLPGPTPHPA